MARDGLFIASSTKAQLRFDIERQLVRMSGTPSGPRALIEGHAGFAVHTIVLGRRDARIDLRPHLTARATRFRGEPFTFSLLEAPAESRHPHTLMTESWRLTIDWNFLHQVADLPDPILSEGQVVRVQSEPIALPCETDLNGALISLGINDIQFEEPEEAMRVLDMDLQHTLEWLEDINDRDPWPS